MSESYFIPAQFIKKSIEPKRSIVDDFKSYISMSFVKSHVIIVEWFGKFFDKVFKDSVSLPTNTTVAPLFKKYVATDLPIPLEVPVIIFFYLGILKSFFLNFKLTIFKFFFYLYFIFIYLIFFIYF